MTEAQLHAFISVAALVAFSPEHALGRDVLVRVSRRDWDAFQASLHLAGRWKAERLAAELDDAWFAAVAS